MSLFGFIGDALGGLFGGGGNKNVDLGSILAPLLAGGLTAQRIPGQTQPGAYTPDGSTVGATYNYIPTGATTVDPLLLQLLGHNFSSGDSAYQATNPANLAILQSILGYTDPTGNEGMRLRGGADDAWAAGRNTANRNANWSDWYNTLGINNDLAYRNLGQIFQNNPFIQQSIDRAGGLGDNMYGAGSAIAGQGADLAAKYGGVTDKLLANPFAAMAQQGAGTAGGMLQNAGASGYGQGQAVAGTAMQGLPAASSVLNTAFDPQNALYQRTLGQTQDQLGTYLANSGLTNSGAGAKIYGDAIRDFNIDWQNNQLGRQTQGLSAFNSGVGGVGQNVGAGQNLQTGGASSYMAGSSLPYETFQGIGSDQLGALQMLSQGLTSGANLQAGGYGLAKQGSTLGSDTYNAMYQPQLAFQNAYSSTGLPGTINATNAMTNAGNAAASGYLNSGMAPLYAMNTLTGMGNQGVGNYLGNSTSLSNLGNQNFNQGLAYLNAVMSGARNAADATRSVAGTTQNQNAGAAAGLTPLIQGGFDILGSLFNRGGVTQNYTSPVFNPSFSF